MATARVMAIFQGGTGEAEDKVVNTFHFDSPADTYAELSVLAEDEVYKFYTSVLGYPTNATQPVGAYLSPWLQRPFEIRTYNLADPPQRVPTIYTHTLPDSASAYGYVEEVAVVCTLEGTPPVTRRRRGRIYLGPFNNQCAAPTSSPSQPTLIDAGMIGNLIKKVKALATDGPGWVIRSEKPEINYVPIVGGYIDNAFDTQRRRGPDATARTEWSLV